MAIIKEDADGKYAIIGDFWVIRPRDNTSFEVGESVVSKHFRGSNKVGMGKLEGRGKYKEYWQISGLLDS